MVFHKEKKEKRAKKMTKKGKQATGRIRARPWSRTVLEAPTTSSAAVQWGALWHLGRQSK
jgi:hypothetical protein